MRRFLLNAEDLPRFAGLYTKSFARETDDTVLLLGAVDEQAQPLVPQAYLQPVS